MKTEIQSSIRLPKTVDDWLKVRAAKNIRSKLGEASAIILEAYKRDCPAKDAMETKVRKCRIG